MIWESDDICDPSLFAPSSVCGDVVFVGVEPHAVLCAGGEAKVVHQAALSFMPRVFSIERTMALSFCRDEGVMRRTVWQHGLCVRIRCVYASTVSGISKLMTCEM